MNRDHALHALGATHTWDVLVIGGGATGLGVALDAATRGYTTALVEARDFAHGTSSRSTKLIHGGVRYLRSGQLDLVRSALHERTVLRRNAPHLIDDLGFIIPAYAWSDRLFYGSGLKLYDLLARGAMPHSRLLSREQTLACLPSLSPRGLRGGVLYHDAQFDDARLALALADTATAAGAAVVNYVRVQALLKTAGRVCGAAVREEETSREFEVRARVVINATGVFSETIRRLDAPAEPSLLTPSQGAHLVLPARFLPGGHALMIPKTSDGRVLFAIPWLDRVIVGTTETPVQALESEPRPFAAEIDFLLEHAARYLEPVPRATDVLSVYAGLRPLVRSRSVGSTAQLSRDHVIVISPTGLVTITGGKWTTYRKMAEDTVDRAAASAGLHARSCRTAELSLADSHLENASAASTASTARAALHPNLPLDPTIVEHAVRHGMARTLEDVLARRTRSLLLDACASVQVAPAVSAIMANELKWSPARQTQALAEFQASARQYLPPLR